MPPKKMPGKSRSAPRSIPPAPAPQQPGPPVPDTPELLFPEATGEDRIRINRLDDYSKREVLHGYLMPEEATEARIAERCGGGQYMVYWVVTDPAGRRVFKSRKPVTILGAYKRPTEIFGQDGPAKPKAEVHTLDARGLPPGANAAELVNSALLGKIMDVLKPSEPVARLDWGPIVTTLGTVLTALIEQRQRGPDSQVLALLERLENGIAKLGQREGPTSSAIGDAVKAVKELLGVRDMLDPSAGGGKPDGETIMWGLAEKLLAATQQGNASPTALPPGTAAPAQETQPLWWQLLAHYRAILVGAAQRGISGESAAELVQRFLPKDQEGVLLELIQRNDAREMVMRAVPQLAEFPLWVEQVVQALRDEYLGDEGPVMVEGEEGDD